MTESPRPLHTFWTRLWALLATVILCLGTWAIGGLLTATSVRDWYPTLRKPSWTPPDWLFAPVWRLLFVLMAVSAWLVWNRVGFRSARICLCLFLMQLTLNLGWSGLFFALQHHDIALVEIMLLWAAIAATLVSFNRVSRLSAALLVPYLLWVSYAAALNGAIWWINT